MMCNITFVDTAKGLVVVDSGASVQIGEMAIRQIRKQFKKPVIAVINSHFHGDHWLGNDAFATAYKGIPIYAHPGTIAEIQGMQGNLWRTLMEQWTNQATLGTRVVPPNTAVDHGKELKFGDVTLRMHHYGKVHTPYDICVEVVEDKLTCIGDIAMDRRIANMDDGSYVGSLKAYDTLEKTAASKIWLPGHGQPSAGVLQWNRELFEGIYRPCEQAIKDGLPMEAAQAERVNAGAAVGYETAVVVVDLGRTLRHFGALQRVAGAVKARLGDFIGGNHSNRLDRRILVTANARTGNDNVALFVRVTHAIGIGISAGLSRISWSSVLRLSGGAGGERDNRGSCQASGG